MIVLKTGDTWPFINSVLKLGTTVVNAEGTTVKFVMSDMFGTEYINQTADVIDGPAGIVEYQWQDGDTDREGIYVGEFKVEFDDGRIASFPNSDYIQIKILPSVAN